MPQKLTLQDKEIMNEMIRKTTGDLSVQPVYPEDETIMERFPGLDPLGKTSEIDLEFAERSAKIRGALQLMPNSVKRQVEALNTAMEEGGEETKSLKERMEHASHFRRLFTRTAREDSAYSASFRSYADELLKGEDVANYDKGITAMEYMVGLRKGAVPEEIKTFCRDTLDCPLNGMALMQKGQALVQTELKVQFENTEHVLQQRYLAKKEHWGEKAGDFEIPDEEINGLTEEHILNYYSSTIDRLLNPLYAGFEEKHKPMRDELIYIDGKSVLELSGSFGKKEAVEEGEKNKQICGMVASALMTGKRVELLQPDPVTGEISSVPAAIKAEGFEPSPERPTMNLWERFWSHFGFYKEKKAAIVEFDNRKLEEEKKQETDHENMKEHAGLINKSLKAEEMETEVSAFLEEKNKLWEKWKEEFYPEGVDKTLKNPSFAYPWDREYLDLAVAVMSAKGYDEREMALSGALLDEKKEAGLEAIRIMKEGDYKGLADTILPFMDKYGNQVVDMDHSDIREYGRHVPELLMRRVSFSFAQDTEPGRLGASFDYFTEQAKDRYGMGLKQMGDLVCGMNSIYMAPDMMEASLNQIHELGESAVGIGRKALALGDKKTLKGFLDDMAVFVGWGSALEHIAPTANEIVAEQKKDVPNKQWIQKEVLDQQKYLNIAACAISCSQAAGEKGPAIAAESMLAVFSGEKNVCVPGKVIGGPLPLLSEVSWPKMEAAIEKTKEKTI